MLKPLLRTTKDYEEYMWALRGYLNGKLYCCICHKESRFGFYCDEHKYKEKEAKKFLENLRKSIS